MKLKEGDVLVSNLDGETFVVEKIVQEMVVLKAKDGTKEILTGLESLKSLYHREIHGTEKTADRRTTIRYLVKDEIVASIHNGEMIIGKVKDISTAGLAFEHLESMKERRGDQEATEWKLYLLNDYTLPGVPCRVVYDLPVPPSSEYQVFPVDFKTKRCGIHFQKLSGDQRKLLEFFLEKYTQGILTSSR